MKLFSIVNTFDKKQRIGFLNYIRLYHKPETAICKIADWLEASKSWIKIKDDNFSRDQLLSDAPIDLRLQTFSNVLATLGNLSEEYMGWMVWKESPNLKRTCQLQGLAQNSLSDIYLKTYTSESKSKQHQKHSIWNEYFEMKILFNNYYFGISPSEDYHTQEFSDLLHSFKKSTTAIAQVLQVEIKNREKLLSESWQQHEPLFNLVCNDESIIKEITQHIIKMNNGGEVDSYDYLKNILWSDERTKYSKHIQYSIVSYSINFLLRAMKQGEKKADELLELYEHSIKHGIYTLNDTITLQKFINIIGFAAKLGKYEWAKNIIDNWAYKVDEKNTLTITRFAHATIDFHQKKYLDVVAKLSQMKTTNFNYRLRYRWLLLISQYEINRNYIEVVKVQLDNFRRFVISNESRISQSTFYGLKASIKLLSMLLSKKPIDKVEEYVHRSQFIFDRRWIMEKIKNPAD